MASDRSDILIVGQGLAGSLLALSLEHAGYRTLVLDDGHRESSSMVAAGLINPVTGMRLVKTPGVDVCLPAALALYRRLGRLFGRRLFHPRPLLRLIDLANTETRWADRLNDPAYRRWIRRRLHRSELPSHARIPAGALLQAHTGYLDLPALLAAARTWLTARGGLLGVRFDPAECSIGRHGVTWRAVKASYLILCQGHRARFCPWFGWLPFQAAKGEILTLEADGLRSARHILNRGRWLLPTHGDRWRLGATYERERLDTDITAQGRAQLMAALPDLVTEPERFRVIRQDAGIRPASRDTRPLIGFHPEHHRIGIFNGLGSKGGLLAPWYAERFTDHLRGAGGIPADANIARFLDHYA